MLYFFYGSDIDTARAKAFGLVAVLQEKRPEAEFFRLDIDNWKEEDFLSLLESQGLFERKCIVLVSRVFENKDAKELILSKISEIKKSDNVFVFLEGVLDNQTLKDLTPFAEKIQVFNKNDVDKDQKFNVFTLADAFGVRDRKGLWVLYQKSYKGGISPEEISGVLFWEVKSLILAQGSASAQEAGLSPFVFRKSKIYSKNFSKDELFNFAKLLLVVYHDSHRGQSDFKVALERFVLSV